MKVYALSNFGEYCTHYDKESIDWTLDIKSALVYDDYKKAYNAMTTINRRYGYDRCRVDRLDESDYKPIVWSIITSNVHRL